MAGPRVRMLAAVAVLVCGLALVPIPSSTAQPAPAAPADGRRRSPTAVHSAGSIERSPYARIKKREPLLLSSAEAEAIVEGHQFMFVVGLHHSGTSLMKMLFSQHSSIAGMSRTGHPEDEGQHMQSVYEPAIVLGGSAKFAYSPKAHLTEEDPRVTDSNRERLISEWGAYWNLSRPVLLEKSPRHVVMTRFLQAVMGRERSHFVVTVRHPLGSYRSLWKRGIKSLKDKGQDPQSLRKVPYQCGREFVEHWLHVHHTLLADLPKLRHKVVVRFEDFVAKAASDQLDRLQDFVGVARTLELNVQESAEPLPAEPHARGEGYVDSDANGGGGGGGGGVGGRPGRRLLEFHGSRAAVKVLVGSEFWWVRDWNWLVNMSRPACQEMVDLYEGKVNEFGYSLIDLDSLSTPRILRPYLLDQLPPS